ncbi:ABC transporter substrate-binding protein [Belnapia sp. T6]|uniref:ABC transporter substrate-binding protein n=1 Tax=Belnapia mucosa TaxID=2804532 RepID=A0ABS1V498_9PROT|nr:ABC transporter substrate-binding protein [Belnapia mucosa]MBL6456504.1 ABC transporter substrate-binding protein [Belnapia mucosa]
MRAGRRHLLLAAPALLIPPTLAHAAPEEREFEMLGVRDPQLGMQLAVAEHFGLFREEGINITFRWQSSGGDVLTVMGSGFPIGVGSVFGQIALASQGMPVKILTGLADISDTQGIALGPKVKITDPRELEGKRFAFTQGNNGPVMFQKLAQRHGFDASKVQLINMAPSEGVIAAAKGDVDGLQSWQPFLYRLTTMGGTLFATAAATHFTGQKLVLPEAEKLLYNHSVVMANQSWIDGKPNTLAALLRALIKADARFKSDPAGAMQGLQRVLRIEPEPLRVMTESNRYGVAISPELVNSYSFTIDWALGIKRIPAPLRPEDGITPVILDAVDRSHVTWRAGA